MQSSARNWSRLTSAAVVMLAALLPIGVAADETPAEPATSEAPAIAVPSSSTGQATTTTSVAVAPPDTTDPEVPPTSSPDTTLEPPASSDTTDASTPTSTAASTATSTVPAAPPESVPPGPVDSIAGGPDLQAADGPVILALGDATLGITKNNSLGGATAKPGDSFDWNIYIACTSIEFDCVDTVFTDVIPPGLIVDEATLPGSNSVQTVTWVPGTRELRIEIHAPTDNPSGVGIPSGAQATIDIGVRVDEDFGFVTGDTITNTASVEGSNAFPVESASTVEIEVPREVRPLVTKSWAPGSAVALSEAPGTITLGVRNGSSTSAEIERLTVTDTTAATFEHFDLTSATVAAWPAGADTAQLLVCTAAASACPPNAFQPGPAVTAPATALAPPGGVSFADVTGVQVAFTNGAGDPLPFDPNGAQVSLGTALRDTFRSNGAPLSPADTIDISNCATPAAVDAVEGEVAGGEACAPFRIFPDTLVLTPTKSVFPDTNGNGTENNGEYAVLGEHSPVTAVINVVNNSPFPVAEVVIQEPSDAVGNEFTKIDVQSVQLTLPAGATDAHLLVTYADGSPALDEHFATNQTVGVGRPGTQVATVTVVYTGEDGGAGSIAPGSTSGLLLHGPLTDAVTADDLAGGSSPGILNCAAVTGDAGRGDGTGTFAGEACDTLQIQQPRQSGEGVKTASQNDFPEGQPVTFTLRTTNNGNVPLVDPVVADPPLNADGEPDLALANPFASLELLGATVTQPPGTPPATIEVFVPGTGWTPLGGADLAAATGIRASIAGELDPLQQVTLNVTVQRRDGVADGVAIGNCYALDAGGDFVPADPWCAPGLSTAPANAGATLTKTIAPAELPVWVPGLEPQEAQVTLRLRNTGNLNASYLQATDLDADFFDSVDFSSIVSVDGPDGADRVQFDAFVGGAWVDGVPTPLNAPAFAAGVDPAAIEGVRVTFRTTSTTNGGYMLTPCSSAACEGTIVFGVTARQALRSDPSASPAGTVTNTVVGAFETWIDEPGSPTLIDENNADLSFVDGTPQLDVDKTPDSTVGPGEAVPFRLRITNNGTANVPDLAVVDRMPPGLGFDDQFVGAGGMPFDVVDVAVPAGTPPPPPPTYEPVVDPGTGRIGEVRWTFEGWNLAPGATLTITFQAQLQPGVLAGEVLVNTMAAGSAVDNLACTAPDGASTDGTYGGGTFCTDTAQATTRAGAIFAARKWVTGNPDLGWYNNRTGETVPVGGGGCPTLSAGGVPYTATPCVALVNPGDQFLYLLRVVNAGTEPALHMTVVDGLPEPGDTGVLGANRDTQWDQRPTLVVPVSTVTPGGTATVGYAGAGPCLDDLTQGGATCPAGAWGGFSTDTHSFQVDVAFETPLPPGQGIEIAVTMVAPFDVTQVATPTIAWNSFAHAETTQLGSGGQRILPPIEPIKVGVALAYGSLEVVKEIGGNPASLAVDGLTYEFAYECTSTPIGGVPTVVSSGSVTATPAAGGTVGGIPAGAVCGVWETGANGGVPSATADSPATVTITAQFSPADPVSSVTVTNEFPIGELIVTKALTGDVREEFLAGPYTVAVRCTYRGAVVEGFPTELTFDGAGSQTVAAPVGSSCVLTEPDRGGAGAVAFTPGSDTSPRSDPVLIPADGEGVAEATVTNEFVPGSIVVVKDVIGAGVPLYSGGPFTFDIDCAFNGVDSVYSTTVTVAGSGDGSTVRSDPVDGLPLGAVCTVTESDSAGADFTPLPRTSTIVAGGSGNIVEVSFLNPFSAGTISIEKVVDGTAAGSDFLDGATFSVAVTCATDDTVDGEVRRAIWYEGTLTAAAGERTTAIAASGDPVLLPDGARCWGAETASRGATSATIDHDSFDTGVAVAADPDAGLQQLTITATNTFDAAVVEVAKTAINGPEGAAYHFAASCTAADVDGTVLDIPVLSGDATFSLAAGESRELSVLAGATCTVIETDVRADAAVAVIDSDGSTAGGDTDGAVVAASGNLAWVEVTNTFQPAPGTTEPPTSIDPDAGILPATR